MTVTAHEAELFPRLGREMLAYLQARAEFITFDSSGAMEEWTAISGSSQRLRLVHQGVDLGEFESIARFGRRVDPEAPVRLMSVARLTPHKRIADAVRAVRELIDEGLNVTYSIVSDGPERATLEAMCADLGLGGHVSFLGFVSRGRLVSELSDADLFVHPSAAEGFGVAVVEAMASGLPVVVANSLGVRDIVDDGNDGYLYEPGDVARLAALLSLLVRNPQMRQTFGRRGREAVFARFAWSRHMEQMNDVWREARRSVAEGGRGR
jgi:glycosyltransferase involved in cell wall biosynthesis